MKLRGHSFANSWFICSYTAEDQKKVRRAMHPNDSDYDHEDFTTNTSGEKYTKSRITSFLPIYCINMVIKDSIQ